jgi:hypothetical protein
MIESMNISRLMPFLSLLLLLPATSSAALVIPKSHLNPSDLCPLIQIVEHELCVSQRVHALKHDANNASDLCVLLHNYNTSFCSGEKNKEQFDTKPVSYDVMSVRILEHEYNNHSQHQHHHKVKHVQEHELKRVDNDVKDIHKVCPIINFIEQELCTSRNEEIKVQFDPKELCPLLNLTYTEICE